jgi:hypothetical protein
VDRALKDKPRQNGGSAEVSEPQAEAEPKPKSVALEQGRKKIAVYFTVKERDQIDAYNKQRCGGGTQSDCIRKLVRYGLQAEGFA